MDKINAFTLITMSFFCSFDDYKLVKSQGGEIAKFNKNQRKNSNFKNLCEKI